MSVGKKEFQDIEYTMEHCKENQQVEKIWHNRYFILFLFYVHYSTQNWWKFQETTGQGGCQEAYRNIKTIAAISVNYWVLPSCAKIYRILHMSGLREREARWKHFLTKKSIQAWLKFTNYTPKTMWNNVFKLLIKLYFYFIYYLLTFIYYRLMIKRFLAIIAKDMFGAKNTVHHQMNSNPTVKHGGCSIMLWGLLRPLRWIEILSFRIPKVQNIPMNQHRNGFTNQIWCDPKRAVHMSCLNDFARKNVKISQTDWLLPTNTECSEKI